MQASSTIVVFQIFGFAGPRGHLLSFETDVSAMSQVLEKLARGFEYGVLYRGGHVRSLVQVTLLCRFVPKNWTPSTL